MTEKKRSSELERLGAMSLYERENEAYLHICGIDEAGRGPLAGPVVAAAVILPKDVPFFYLNDSKKLSEKRREALFEELQEKAVAIGVGSVSEEVIDEINILQATLLAMRKALDALSPPADLALVDALTLPELKIPQISIIKGDAKSISIAAASVIAKVTRDRVMKEMDALSPEYGFAKHKGYGTAAHIAALKKYGPCRIHRRSFIGHFV